MIDYVLFDLLEKVHPVFCFYLYRVVRYKTYIFQIYYKCLSKNGQKKSQTFGQKHVFEGLK